jgi:DNA-binding MarR family transcriptional regulator|tara:strand:- start:181 stop:657 length:477 start_codon:yes stop_codon:yes gene_type:complete
MYDHIDSDTFFFLLLDIARMLRAEFEHGVNKAELEITPSEARTLVNIARFGPLGQNDLADMSGFGAMSATRMLKNLEDAGLISRSTNLNDRRVKMVQIDNKAAPLLAKLGDISDEVKGVTRGSIPSQNWRAFENLLKVVRDNHLAAYHAKNLKEIEPK